MRQGIQWWVLGSGVLMLIGAFGPWVTVLAISVAGTDGSNDGWLVVASAGIGGGLCYAMRRSRVAGVWALVGGIVGIAVTAYDRGNVQNAINGGGVFGRSLAHVGWGLNLALLASISMGLAGLVALIQARSAPTAAPSSAPPSTPSSQPAPTAAPQSAPTSTPSTSSATATKLIAGYGTPRQDPAPHTPPEEPLDTPPTSTPE